MSIYPATRTKRRLTLPSRRQVSGGNEARKAGARRRSCLRSSSSTSAAAFSIVLHWLFYLTSRTDHDDLDTLPLYPVELQGQCIKIIMICSRCKIEKPEEDFYLSHVTQHTREWMSEARYGMQDRGCRRITIDPVSRIPYPASVTSCVTSVLMLICRYTLLREPRGGSLSHRVVRCPGETRLERPGRDEGVA